MAWHFRAQIAHPHSAIASLVGVQAHMPALFAVGFFIAYLLVTACCVPIEIAFAVAAGALFGLVEGVVLASFASAAGASLAFLGTRFLFREPLKPYLADQLQRVDEGIAKDGPAYLLSLRLLPIFPFQLVNLLLGMTGMRLRTFYLFSQLGMLPALVLYVNAGTQLARVKDMSGLISPGMIAALIALAIFPWAVKGVLAIWRRSIGRQERADG